MYNDISGKIKVLSTAKLEIEKELNALKTQLWNEIGECHCVYGNKSFIIANISKYDHKDKDVLVTIATHIENHYWRNTQTVLLSEIKSVGEKYERN